MELEVRGMSCSHCERAVTKALQAIDPGAKVAVDLAGGRVTVETARPRADVAAAIEDAGYTVA